MCSSSYVSMYIYLCICMYKHIHKYIFIYINICLYIFIYIYTLRIVQLGPRPVFVVPQLPIIYITFHKFYMLIEVIKV